MKTKIKELGDLVRPWTPFKIIRDENGKDSQIISKFKTSDNSTYRVNISQVTMRTQNGVLNYCLLDRSDPESMEILDLLNPPYHMSLFEFAYLEPIHNDPVYKNVSGLSKKTVFEVFATVKDILLGYLEKHEENIDILMFSGDIPRQPLYDSYAKLLSKKLGYTLVTYDIGLGKAYVLIKPKE